MSLVSIIMPCFNSEKFIGESIESVLSQEYSQWELLVCDDSSIDNSKNIIKSYQKIDSRIKIISNNYSKGAPGARNSCLDVAKGRYIAFLDADDLWYPEKLTQQINFMISNKYHFCFSYCDVVDEQSTYLHQLFSPKIVNKKNVLFSCFLPCLTVIYDAMELGKIYQPNIKKRNDYALWLKILFSDAASEAYCLEKVTASYRKTSYGLSSGSKLELLFYYRMCLIKFASVSKLFAFFLCIPYLAIGFFKKYLPNLYNKLVIKF